MRAAAAVAIGLVLAGCGTIPKANVAEPGVYTSPLLMAVDADLSSGGTSVAVNQRLREHFLTLDSEYDAKKLRADAMLDANQRTSVILQAVVVSNAIKVAAELIPKVVPAPTPAAEPGKNGATPEAPEKDEAPKEKDPNDPPAKGDVPKDDATRDGSKKDDAAKDATAKDGAAAPVEKPGETIQDMLAKLVAGALKNPSNDSPFDRLDRVADFYAALQVKLLRRYGDSRTADDAALARRISAGANTPEDVKTALKPMVAEKPTTDPAAAVTLASPAWREVMLAFPVQVRAGQRPNFMVGVRIQIVGVKVAGGEDWLPVAPPNGDALIPKNAIADSVRIARLHPMRNYDLEDVDFGESLSESLALAGAFKGPVGGGVNADAEFTRDVAARSEVKRRFLSRITKNASYANPDLNVFGWDFFPTNLEVIEENPLFLFFNFFGGTPRRYKVRAYLESGGRDCAAVLLVKSNVTAIRYRVWHVTDEIDKTELLDPNENSFADRIENSRRLSPKMPGDQMSPDDVNGLTLRELEVPAYSNLEAALRGAASSSYRPVLVDPAQK